MSSIQDRNKRLYESMVSKYGKAAVEKAIIHLKESDNSISEKRDKKLYESLVKKYGKENIHNELKRLNESKNINDEEIIIVC